MSILACYDSDSWVASRWVVSNCWKSWHINKERVPTHPKTSHLSVDENTESFQALGTTLLFSTIVHRWSGVPPPEEDQQPSYERSFMGEANTRVRHFPEVTLTCPPMTPKRAMRGWGSNVTLNTWESVKEFLPKRWGMTRIF